MMKARPSSSPKPSSGRRKRSKRGGACRIGVCARRRAAADAELGFHRLSSRTCVDVEGGPFTLALADAGTWAIEVLAVDVAVEVTRAYLAHQNIDGVTIVDPIAGAVVRVIPLTPDVCFNAHVARLTEDEERIMVVCEGDHGAPGTFVVLNAEPRRHRRAARRARHLFRQHRRHEEAAMRLLAASAMFIALAAAGCPAPTGAEVRERIFNDPRLAEREFNSSSCATCHNVYDAKGGSRIGVTLKNVVGRPTWWGGYSPRLLDAVNFCNVFFMRGAPLEPSDPRARALYEYLVSVSPDATSPEMPLTVVENVTTVPRGDPRRGEEVYNASCRVCHGAPRTGVGRINELTSIIPNASIEFAVANDFDPELVIIEKIRHGQFFAVGGNMPMFTREALSEEDLSALMGFLDP